jgi:hypothetical protein
VRVQAQAAPNVKSVRLVNGAQAHEYEVKVAGARSGPAGLVGVLSRDELRRTHLDLSEQLSEKAPVTKTAAGR